MGVLSCPALTTLKKQCQQSPCRALMRSTREIQQHGWRHGLGQVVVIGHGAGKPGPKPPRIVWVRTASGWVAA